MEKSGLIYIVGNSVVPGDAIPESLIKKLIKVFPKISFKRIDPTENWWENERKVVLIDTVLGIEKVSIFHSIQEFERNNRLVSPHDYDLYYDLALLLKLRKIDQIEIIGLPVDKTSPKIFLEVKYLISTILDV